MRFARDRLDRKTLHRPGARSSLLLRVRALRRRQVRYVLEQLLFRVLASSFASLAAMAVRGSRGERGRMSTNSGIEWTQTTWNPIAGCTPVSPGCLNVAARCDRLQTCAGDQRCRTSGIQCRIHMRSTALGCLRPASDDRAAFSRARVGDAQSKPVLQDFRGGCQSCFRSCGELALPCGADARASLTPRAGAHKRSRERQPLGVRFALLTRSRCWRSCDRPSRRDCAYLRMSPCQQHSTDNRKFTRKR